MFSIKFITAIIITSSIFSGGMSSGCNSRNRNPQVNKAVAPTEEDKPPSELKVLAEGSHSFVNTPFVAVVRDAQTYAALRNLVGSVPDLGAEFFQSNVLIAGFLGTRNTGGYSVEITRDASGQIRVAEKAPGKDVMVPQMITAPYKVVSLAISGTPPVSLSLGATFQQSAQLYRISNGTFTVSGGFTGRSETFQLAGKLQVSRLADLITIVFAVVSSGTSRERMLRDTATGLVREKDSSIIISKLSRGSLLDSPSGDLHVSGTFGYKSKLILDLASPPINVPESYSGQGRIEAEMVAASAN